MSNLFSLLNNELIANVVEVQALSDIMVLIIARCLSFPVAGPALNDGQNNHRNKVPENK